jgi:2,5-dihydroxypyridine 5,6-dioxygenase
MYHPQYSADSRIIELIGSCKIPFELNAKPGNKVLVVTDTAMDPVIWRSLLAAGNAFGCEMTVSIMEPLPFHSADPPATVAEAMKNADLCITLTSTEFHQNEAREAATRAGVRVVIMEQDTVEMLAGPICAQADYASMSKFGSNVENKFKKGHECRITSETGCDFTITVGPDRDTWVDLGRGHHGLTSFPGGEVCVSALGESCEGVVVWDTSAHYPVGLFKEPVKLIVHKGIVEEIQGGPEAEQLRNYIKTYGDANTYKFTGEICVGINPKVTSFTGVLRNDKKKYGKIHTSIGKWMGQPSKLHIDGITAKPTIEIDGEAVVRNGFILVPPLDKWQ